jgi:serine/threonine-protein kinase
VLGIGVTLGIALWQANVARNQARIAHQQVMRAEAVRQFLEGVFSRADPDENGGQPISVHALLEMGVQQVGKGTYDSATEADVAALLAHFFVQVGDFKSANDLIKKALPIGADPSAPPDIRARVLLGAADLELQSDAYDASLAHAREGLALLDDSMPNATELRAGAHWVIAHYFIAKREWDAAEKLLRDALKQDADVPGRGNDSLVEEWVSLGEVLDYTSRFDDSQDAFEHALAIARPLYGENSSRVAHVLHEFGNMLSDRGDFAGTERMLAQVLDIRRRTVGPTARDTLVDEHDLLVAIESEGRIAESLPQRLQLIETAKHAQMHPSDLAYFTVRAGTDLRDLGRFGEAESTLREAIDMFDSSLGADAPKSVPTLLNLGSTLMLDGRHADARIALEHALAILAKHGNPTAMANTRIQFSRLARLEHHPDEALRQAESAAEVYRHADPRDWGRVSAFAELSEAQRAAGQRDAALASAQTAVKDVQTLLPRGNYISCGPLLALARANLALGHASEAEPLLREALAACSPPYPPDDPRVLEIKVALVNALDALGRADEARTLRGNLEPLLKASASPYLTDLRQQLAATSK